MQFNVSVVASAFAASSDQYSSVRPHTATNASYLEILWNLLSVLCCGCGTQSAIVRRELCTDCTEFDKCIEVCSRWHSIHFFSILRRERRTHWCASISCHLGNE